MKPELTTAEVARSVRPLRLADLDAVAKLDAELTGEPKEPYWRDVLNRFLGNGGGRIGLGAVRAEGGPQAAAGERLEGYLFGELRAFEFGSETCGWIFAVGVRQDAARAGVASALMTEARERFRALGVTVVRTMVRRTDVPLLSFFRRNGFVGGPFVQLELDARTGDDALDELEASA